MAGRRFNFLPSLISPEDFRWKASYVFKGAFLKLEMSQPKASRFLHLEGVVDGVLCEWPFKDWPPKLNPQGLKIKSPRRVFPARAIGSRC